MLAFLIANPIELTIAPKTGEQSRWCAAPTFEATVKNSSAAPVWLDLGSRDSALVVTSYFVDTWANRHGSSQGGTVGMSDDWVSIAYLRRSGRCFDVVQQSGAVSHR